jgi:chromosome partitioning protein
MQGFFRIRHHAARNLRRLERPIERPGTDGRAHMRVVASCSGKGGVGKTTVAVNVAALAARSLRVMLWDLDPQGAATHCLAAVPAARGATKGVVRGRRTLVDEAVATRWQGLALVAADRSARNLDRLLDDEHRLHSMLRPLREHYDLVVLDCPPGAGRLAEHVVEAADGLLVPLIPGPLSVRALDQLGDLVTREVGGSRNGRRRPTLLPFFSMVDRRKRLHRDTIEAVQLARPETLSAQIPISAEIERMPVYRAPIVSHAPDGLPARAFAELWREAQLRLAWAEQPVDRV